MYLAHLHWREAQKVLSNPDSVFVIPIGSTEQHGPIGPLGTDWLIPRWITAEMEKRTPIVVTPVIPFGVATHHTSFPGTIDLGLETLIAVMRGVFQSLFKHGARRFIVVNGHGGNDPAIEKAALEISRQGGLVSLLNWWSIAPQLNPAWITGHGDAQEVAAMLAVQPDLVKLQDAIDTKVNDLTEKLHFTHLGNVTFKGAQVKVIREIRDTINTGGFGGLPSENATQQWGDEMMAAIVDYFVDYVEEFQKAPLPQRIAPNSES